MELSFFNHGFKCDTCDKDTTLPYSSQECSWTCDSCMTYRCFACNPILDHNLPILPDYPIPTCKNKHDMEIVDYCSRYICKACGDKTERDDHWQCPKCEEHICTLCKPLPLNHLVMQFHDIELPPEFHPKPMLRTIAEPEPVFQANDPPIHPFTNPFETPASIHPNSDRPKCSNHHDMFVSDEVRFTCDLCEHEAEYIDHWRCWRCDEDFCAQCKPIPASFKEEDIELQ